MVSFRFTLLLLALIAPASLAQASPDGAFLPEGIEATGDTAEVRALTAWAEEHWQTDPDQAWQSAERALALARNLDDKRGIAVSANVLGNIIPDFNRKEEYYAAALEVYEQLGDQRKLIRVQSNMATVYMRRGDLERALATYLDVLNDFKRIGDREGEAGTLSNISSTHYALGNLEEAVVYSERAIVLAEMLDRPRFLATILDNFASILADHGSYENAETVLHRALTISREQGFRSREASASNNLGFVYNAQGRHEQALPFLLTAEHLGKELGEDGVLIPVYDELGKAYLGLGQYDRALHNATESLTLAREMGSVSRQMEGHQTLSRIFKAAGNYEQALAHHEHYVAARDSVFNAERTEIITEMQTRYETEEKQRANERLQQELQIQALRTSRWQAWMIGGVSGLLLLLGFLYYRYRVKQRANHLLEELDAAKSRFFANISHEFRTPLTVILGGLQDALAGRFGTLSEKLANQNQAMLRNTRQLQSLIDEVLALNRLEAGKLELNPVPGDLVRSIKRIVEADTPMAERNGLDLTFEHDVEQCPRLYDEEKLEKIVGNLLSNALKFIPKGGSVRIELRCGKETEIAVSDTGPGIPAEMQEKVFERFAQVEDGALHHGTGIGLALAKELAELHGGAITLESTSGEGSTFTVRLPLERVSLDDGAGAFRKTPLQRNTESAPLEKPDVSGNGAAPSGQPDAVEVGESGGKAELDRTTVLIIEDNDDVRALVRRSLEETYRILEAADGETGLQQARTELPDLIVSDIMLPGIDGYEIARRLKAEPDTECIPVVMLTARAAEEDQTEGYGSGAEVYITKPFSPETLRAAVARLLEERRRLRKRLQESAKQEKEEATRNGEPTLADRARAVVLENLHDENFSVEELANALGMSRSALERQLKPERGLTPGKFIQRLRLEQAKKLLLNGAGSVSEVAYAVGFKSLSHFSRSFREHHGELPSRVLGTRVKTI